jgi:hypothetical protein
MFPLFQTLRYTAFTGIVCCLMVQTNAQDFGDYFNSPPLHPAWQVSLLGEGTGNMVATGYDATIHGYFRMNRIFYTGTQPRWVTVALTRQFRTTPEVNFDVYWRFLYQNDALSDTQRLLIELLSADNRVLAIAGYEDGQVNGRGRYFCQIGSQVWQFGSLGIQETSTFTLSRRDGSLRMLWNSYVMMSAPMTEAIARVRVKFGHLPLQGATFLRVYLYSIDGNVYIRQPGDVNGDLCVDDTDLLAVLFAFGYEGQDPADLDGNHLVDDGDLLLVLFNFGQGIGC